MYQNLDSNELRAEKELVLQQYNELCAQGLNLNMARGKPSKEQLDLNEPLLTVLSSSEDCYTSEGLDCRNYGVLDGIPEAKQLMAVLLDDEPERTIVGGSASLTLMYNALARCMSFGTLGSKPWNTYENISWLCPVPGYDRHFAMLDAFGITMIPIEMDENGPDMDAVEKLIANDESIKGIWCVPKYSNPSGITYSDETVERLASMECAAKDFRIFWDNAYAVHHLYDNPEQQDKVLDIAKACQSAGNPNRYFKFASTSKITFPGAGVAALASSNENIEEIKMRIRAGLIGYDKLNQLRHARFLNNGANFAEHMSKHAAIIRPKFELVLRKLNEGLSEVGGCSWTNPRGGYFISFDGPQNTAKRIVELASDAGVIMTSAGATWPHGIDPHDSNIRIAPTLPPLEELDKALDVFVCCTKLAYLENLLAQ